MLWFIWFERNAIIFKIKRKMVEDVLEGLCYIMTLRILPRNSLSTLVLSYWARD